MDSSSTGRVVTASRVVWFLVVVLSGLFLSLLPDTVVGLVAICVLVLTPAFGVLLTVVPLAVLRAPRTFWLALAGRCWRSPSGVTDRRFLGPYVVCVFLGSVAWFLVLLRVELVLSAVGVGDAWPVAFVVLALVVAVGSAFVLSQAADVPGGPTSSRAVLEWVAFVTTTVVGYVVAVVVLSSVADGILSLRDALA